MVTRKTTLATGNARRLSALQERLGRAKTEEDLKAAWAKALNLDYDTSEDVDLYTPQVLFEFKFGGSIAHRPRCAQVLAQTMYYLRRLRLGQDRRAIPARLALIDRETVVFTDVADWKDIYAENEGRFDWDLAPSKADPRLAATIQGHPALRKLQVFSLTSAEELTAVMERFADLFSPQGQFDFGDKKQITEDNFEDVFAYWNESFGDAVRNGFNSSRYFVNDIQPGRTQVVADQGRVYFQVGPEEVRIKQIFAEDYERFWRLYDKVRHGDVLRGILAKIDRLTDEVERRKHGEFFTPLRFARKALDYVERTVGARCWESGRFRLWDMAAGTGNLQYHLPAAAWPYLYLSTLYREDVEHCQRLFPGVEVFQYDYLNDDVGNLLAGGGATADGQHRFEYEPRLTWRLPARLREDLANPEIQWIVPINPPFATAQQGGAAGANKAEVSHTAVRQEMHAQGLGEVSRELLSQFIFRIRREFHGRRAWLGLFSKIKYLNANNDQGLRDRVFRFLFERGFMFSSVNFAGTSRTSRFPVGFLLWRLFEEKALEDQQIVLDVFDNEVRKIDAKRIASEHRDEFLSKWIARPAATLVFPPLSSAITVKLSGPDIRDRVSPGFLASLMCKGNDLQNQNMTALLSGPYASAGALSVVPENFERAMVVHAVRRLPKAAWHNDRDPFMQPTAELPREFVEDCVPWSLYANSNHTVSLQDVEYDGRTHRMPNHLFPVAVTRLRDWSHADPDLAVQLPTAEDRFAARWLAGRRLSPEAAAVAEAGEAVFRCFYEHANQLRTVKFGIRNWDAGWWQVRGALSDRDLGAEPLAALKAAHDALKVKLLPQVYALGFLR